LLALHSLLEVHVGIILKLQLGYADRSVGHSITFSVYETVSLAFGIKVMHSEYIHIFSLPIPALFPTVLSCSPPC
jgi:hypothetical protein